MRQRMAVAERRRAAGQRDVDRAGRRPRRGQRRLARVRARSRSSCFSSLAAAERAPFVRRRGAERSSCSAATTPALAAEVTGRGGPAASRLGRAAASASNCVEARRRGVGVDGGRSVMSARRRTTGSRRLTPRRLRALTGAALAARPWRCGLGLLGERRERRRARAPRGRPGSCDRASMPAAFRPLMNCAVGEAVLARGGVDADDPQAAEVALLAAAADEGVLERRVDRLFR